MMSDVGFVISFISQNKPMARLGKGSLLEGLRGTLGKEVVFKQYEGSQCLFQLCEARPGIKGLL